MSAIEPTVRPPAAPRRPMRAHVYSRPPEPVYFPEAEEALETNRHLELRTALYLILKRELAHTATLGSDQFVYWDPRTSKKRLTPDAFVRLGVPHRTFRTWKTWLHGAPDLGVEIVSDSDEGEPDWDEKLERYRAAGIREIVRFHPEDRERPIHIWDALDGDLVERAPDDPDLRACETLGLWWTVVEDRSLGPMLRLARDREGHDLLPTPDEAEAQAREAEARARESEAKVREANEKLQAEVQALRAELAQAKGKRRTRRRSPG
ncbi:Uma2 family endonuclease [Sorangium sp. So ce321]|uniref:Uma2 family endonuclease n=1 Tax=Sorangium sp. So ce321 TaxID=3133300 RepID=UPI003F6478B1